MKKLLGLLLVLIVFGCEDLPELGVPGCMDPAFCNYNPEATVSATEGNLKCNGIVGCFDAEACNYNAESTCNDVESEGYDVCIFPPIGENCDGANIGCMDTTGCNYNELAEIDDGSCTYPPPGQNCDDQFLGCTNNNFLEFYSQGFTADIDDGSCITPVVFGCMDQSYCNYDPAVNWSDNSCSGYYGCTDATSCNFDSNADCDDGSCSGLLGCINADAYNYNPNATCDDNSCLFYVQYRLDNGQTPLQIMQLGYPEDSLWGKSYAGGIIFHFNQGQNKGLVMSLAPVPVTGTQTNGSPWYANWGSNVSVGTSTAIFTGAYNNVLINSSNTYGTYQDPYTDQNIEIYRFDVIADAHVSSGYNDWYVPSIYELIAINSNLALIGNVNFGSSPIWYVSSSEVGASAYNAYQIGGNSQANYGTPVVKLNYSLGVYNIIAVRTF